MNKKKADNNNVYGWTGKILKVDLSTSEIKEESLPKEFLDKYIGGAGVNARLLYDALRDNPSTKAIMNAPVVVVACAKRGRSGYDAGKLVTDKGDWYMFDVALSMQNLMLAAHSLGLATVHVGAFDAKKVADILEIPQGYCVVEMTPLGYPDQVRALRPRKELTEIVFYNRFGVGIKNSS